MYIPVEFIGFVAGALTIGGCWFLSANWHKFK